MSDTHHDDHAGHDGHDDHEGGHEIDRMPNGRLFNLLFGLSALTLLACIGVIQLFNMQVDALETSRAEQGSFRVNEYIDEMNKTKSGWGPVEVKELDDKNTTTTRWHMPLASARKAVLDDPKLLEAFKPVGAWKTADEQAPAAAADKKVLPTDGAGMRPAMPQPGRGEQPSGAQPDGAAQPAGAQPAGAQPAGAQPAEGAAKPAPAERGAKPEFDETAAPDAKGDAKAEPAPKPKKPRAPKPAPTEAPAPAEEPAAADAG